HYMLSPSALTRLQYQHTTIRELITGLTEEQLKRVLHPAKWTAFDNIAHLARYQPMFLLRLERIHTEHAPVFERYVAETDPQFNDYQQRPRAELLNVMDKRRDALLAQVR